MKKRIGTILAIFMVLSICTVGVYATMQEITRGQIGSVEITGTLYAYENYDSESFAYGRTFLEPNSGVQSAYCTVKVYPYSNPSDPATTTASYTGSSIMTTSTISVINGTHAESEHNAEILESGVLSTLAEPLQITVDY